MIEVADILLEPSCGHREAYRQQNIRANPGAQLPEIGHAIVEHVDHIALRIDQRRIEFKPVIANPCHALQIDIADAGVEAWPGIDTVEPAFGILAWQRVIGRAAAAIKPCARGEAARLEAQGVGNQRQRATRDPADGVGINIVTTVGNVALIPQRNRRAAVAALHVDIDPGGDLGIGQHIITRRQFSRDNLRNFDIGLHHCSAALASAVIAAAKGLALILSDCRAGTRHGCGSSYQCGPK